MKRRQSILIVLFVILYSKTFSQALNSQETIKYINDKLIVFSDENDKSFIWQFKIENYGTIVQYSSHQTLLYNFSDINNIIYEKENNQHFIRMYCKNKTCITSQLNIGAKQQWDYLSIGVVSEIEAKKLVTALIHLKSLLIKKDPFDN